MQVLVPPKPFGQPGMVSQLPRVVRPVPVVVVVDEGAVAGAAEGDELACADSAVSAAFAAGFGAGHADIPCSFEPQLKHCMA